MASCRPFVLFTPDIHVCKKKNSTFYSHLQKSSAHIPQSLVQTFRNSFDDGQIFYIKLLLGLYREKLSYLNCLHLHILTWRRFSMPAARRLFVLAPPAFDLVYKKNVWVCIRVYEGSSFCFYENATETSHTASALNNAASWNTDGKCLKLWTRRALLITVQMEDYRIKWWSCPCWWSNKCHSDYRL